MFESQKRRSLLLVCHSLMCGGAERVMVLLAQGLSDRGHQVSIVTIANEETDFYTLPAQVKRIALDASSSSLNIAQAVSSNINRLSLLRQTILSLQPDVVISFMNVTNVLVSLAALGTGCKVVITEHNNFTSLDSKPWQILRRLTYPMAAKLVSVSQGVDVNFQWLPAAKRTVIYNPLTPSADRQLKVDFPPGADLQRKWIVAIGRLVEQKNFSLLLSAFQKVAARHQDWQLLIFGEGELRSRLEQQVEQLGLTDRVLLPGITRNPFGIYQRAQLYVMSSLWEGLPLVLCEALACGLPVISTNCPSGPAEIVRDGIDGILVPNRDETALAQAMDLLMSDEMKRAELSSKAKEADERFSLVKIIGEWERLIDELMRSTLPARSAVSL